MRGLRCAGLLIEAMVARRLARLDLLATEREETPGYRPGEGRGAAFWGSV